MTIQDREWTSLAEGFVASNGLTVEFLRNSGQLHALGKRFKNALSDPGHADRWAALAESGKEQIYQVVRDGEALSCGELHVVGGEVVVDWNRGARNAPGSPESGAAIAEFVKGVNDGSIEANLAITAFGFEPKASAPAP